VEGRQAVKRKYGIPLFIILTYALTFTGGQVFTRPQISSLIPRLPLTLLRILFIPAVVAPFSVALLLSYLEGRKAGVKDYLNRFSRRGVRWHWYLLAVLVPVAVHFLASLLDSRRGTRFLPPFGEAGPRLLFSAAAIFALAGCGEEMGWRGYLLPRLQEKLDSTSSSVAVGLVTACWHLPLFLIPGALHSQHQFLPFLLLSVAFSFSYTCIMDNTGSVLVAALFHTFHDVASMNFSQKDHLSSFSVYAAIALIIVLYFGPKRFRKPQLHLEE
jgi:membrane protease YdiL (CAAX protease family)